MPKKKICQRRKFVKKTGLPNFIKSLGYIKCYSFSSPRSVKGPATVSDTTVRRSVLDLEDINHTGNPKKGHISLGYEQAYYLQVF